jgi:hypothetical protein
MTHRTVFLGAALVVFSGCAVPVDETHGKPALEQQEPAPPPAGNANTTGSTGIGAGGSSGTGGSATGGQGGQSGEAGAAGAGVGGSGEPVINEPDLAASYAFEDALEVKDGSGHENHGAPEGTGLTLGIPGKVGNAASFSGMDGHITVPSSTDLDFVSAATIEFWVRLNSVTPGAIVSRGLGASDNSVVVRTAQGNLQITFARVGLGAATLVSEPNVIGASWTHVAIVNDGNTLSLYLDGQLEKTAPGGYLGNIGKDLRIGKSAANDSALNGVLDEVKWWTTARSAEEICGDAGGSWTKSEGTGTCSVP